MKAAKVLKSFEDLPQNWSGPVERDVPPREQTRTASQDHSESGIAPFDEVFGAIQSYRQWGINE